MGFLSKVVAKIEEYVKPLPWLQYVGLQVSLFPGLPELVVGAAALVSVSAYILRTKHGLGPNDPLLRRILDLTGYPLLVAGLIAHVPVAQFVGGALVMTEFVYELIYP